MTEQQHQGRGQDPDVQGVEARQRVMAVDGPADQDRLEHRADAGDAAGDVGRHLSREEALLVPRQQITRERQAQDDAHERDAEPPVHFARRQMGPGDDDLQHVDGEEDDHRLRAEVVQAADQPAEVHLILDEVDGAPAPWCRSANTPS